RGVPAAPSAPRARRSRIAWQSSPAPGARAAPWRRRGEQPSAIDVGRVAGSARSAAAREIRELRRQLPCLPVARLKCARMRRALGRFDVTCLGLSAIVGSGIFLLPDDLYRELGVWSPLAF